MSDIHDNSDNVEIKEEDKGTGTQVTEEVKTEAKEVKKEEKKESIETKKEETVQLSKRTIYIIAGVITVLAVLVAMFCFTTAMNVFKTQSEPEVPNAAGIVLKGSKRNTALTALTDGVNDLRSKNIMVTVQDGADYYTTLLYNSKHEAIAEAPDTGYKTIYFNDHRTVQFSSKIGYGYDSDVFSLLESVVSLAKTNDLNVMLQYVIGEESIMSDDGKTGDYAIDIRGWDEIQQLYSAISESFGQTMTDTLKQSVEQASQVEGSSITADTEISMRMVFTLEDGVIKSAGCYIYFIDTPSGQITWDDLSQNWMFDSYIEIYDWELDEQWYEIDWETLPDMEDTTDIENLFLNQYIETLEMLNEYATDNGLDELVYDLGTSGSNLVDETDGVAGTVEDSTEDSVESTD